MDFLFKLLWCQMYDFTPMIFAVPIWGSEATNFKTEIHLINTASEVTWACDVTTTEREGDFTSLGMLLRLVEVVRRSCKRPEARNTLRNRLVVWFTAVLTCLSVLLFSQYYYLVYTIIRPVFSPLSSKMLWSCRCRVHVWCSC